MVYKKWVHLQELVPCEVAELARALHEDPIFKRQLRQLLLDAIARRGDMPDDDGPDPFEDED